LKFVAVIIISFSFSNDSCRTRKEVDVNDIVGRPTYFFNNRFSIRVYNLYESVREKNVERSLLKTTFFDSTYDSYIYIRRIFFEIYVRRVRVKRKWWTEFIDGRKELSWVKQNRTFKQNRTKLYDDFGEKENAPKKRSS